MSIIRFVQAADLPQLLQKFLGIRLGRCPVYIVFRHNGIHQRIQGAFLLEGLENKAAQLVHGNQAVDFRRAGTGRHQNRDNVLQKEQGFLSRWGVTIFTVAFSTYFTYLVPAGVGLYWIASNLFAIANLYFMNFLYKPSKYIDYEALEESKKELEELKAKDVQKKKELEPYKKQESDDYHRFLSDKEHKQLVFYSEGSGFYKYFAGMIDYVLKHSDIVIHYITSDPKDAVFSMNEPKLKPYYIGEMKLITLMMKMDADMVIILAGHIHGAAVGQMAALAQIHAHHRVTQIQQAKVNGHIRLSTAVGLYIGIGCAKELLCPVDGDLLAMPFCSVTCSVFEAA